jgi:hypothetical protein
VDLDDRAGDGLVAVALDDVLDLELVGRRLSDGTSTTGFSLVAMAKTVPRAAGPTIRLPRSSCCAC